MFFACISKTVNNQCDNPKHFWKALVELYNFDFYENVRNRKFIADNSSLKKFLFFKLELYVDFLRFRRNRSCRARKDLSKNVWVVALIVYRFRDKCKKHPLIFK